MFLSVPTLEPFDERLVFSREAVNSAELLKKAAESFKDPLLSLLLLQCPNFPQRWHGRRFNVDGDGGRFTNGRLRALREVVEAELATM